MNSKDKVSLVKCEEYEYALLCEKIKETLAPLGGIEKYVKQGTKVLVKPNLIIMKNPQMAVTTNPLFVKEVCSLIIEAGGIVTIADSPGGPYTEQYLEMVYSACQIKKIAKELDVKLNYNTGSKAVQFHINGNDRAAKIINPVFENDIIINLPKLKTHVMSNFTGAVKNNYGLVPGIVKANYHFQYSDKKQFFSYITDLCCYLKPVLNIADGIDILEGDGPTNGDKRFLGLIMASENPFNLDLIAHTIFGFSKNEIYTSQFGEEYQLQPQSPKEVETVGEDYKDYLISDIKKPNVQSSTFDEKIPKFLRKPIQKFLTPYPTFKKEKCIKCKNCIHVCPAKVLEFSDSAPRLIDKSKCIRCYCCHEMCPNHAVHLRKLPKILR